MAEKIRRGLGWVIAGITCPCHLPVTAPLVLGWLAGTGLGAYLSTHLEILAAVSTALFLGGLALAIRGGGDRKEGESSGRAACRPARLPAHRRR